MKVKYSSNNSGGGWWLKDEDWANLEKAGWAVKWADDKTKWLDHTPPGEPKRWLGALATYAEIECETPADAMRSFEQVTGQKVSDEGCNCCGPPHSFSWGKGEKYDSASGEGCLEHLYPGEKPATLRDALEQLSQKKGTP